MHRFISLCLFLFAPALLAAQAKLDVGLGQPVLHAGKKQTTYVKVGITGFAIEDARTRTPVNIALVLDRSGSMSGEKIARAREAAISVLDRLDANDILSVVTFEAGVQVLVPATKLTDKDAVRAAISRIEPAGGTALFGGVSKGAEEVRKFLDKNRVNRVIMLTDGLANVGPQSPGELGALGASLRKEGISVTTLGLGLDYNEDLLAQLAAKSDGNHAFIKNSSDLARIFNAEFGDVLSVCGQEVLIRIQVAEGIRPVRVMGREAEVNGQTVVIQLNQLYSRQEKFVVLEIEVPAGEEGRSREVATVTCTYANMLTKTTDKLTSTVSVNFSRAMAEVEKNENKAVMVDCTIMVGNENNKLATQLRDQGKIEEARDAFGVNAGYLKYNFEKYGDKKLEIQFGNNLIDAKSVDPEKWAPRRKETMEEQFINQTQRKR